MYSQLLRCPTLISSQLSQNDGNETLSKLLERFRVRHSICPHFRNDLFKLRFHDACKNDYASADRRNVGPMYPIIDLSFGY
jgi:hypothetical protein